MSSARLAAYAATLGLALSACVLDESIPFKAARREADEKPPVKTSAMTPTTGRRSVFAHRENVSVLLLDGDQRFRPRTMLSGGGLR